MLPEGEALVTVRDGGRNQPVAPLVLSCSFDSPLRTFL